MFHQGGFVVASREVCKRVGSIPGRTWDVRLVRQGGAL